MDGFGQRRPHPPIALMTVAFDLNTQKWIEKREINDIFNFIVNTDPKAAELLENTNQFHFGRLETTDDPGLIGFRQHPGGVFFLRLKNEKVELEKALTHEQSE